MNLRVLHVVRSLRRETGGLAEAVRNLAAAQRRAGDTVALASLDPADAGDEAVTVTFGRSSEGYGYAPDYARWLRARRDEFDAVVVHGLWQYQGLGTRQALRGGATPYVVFCHGMLDPWFKRTYPLKHAKKWLYWPWAEYRVLRDAAAVCFTAEDERRRARESFPLYRAHERITTLGIAEPPGDPAAQREAFLATQPALRDREFVLFLGRIHEKKGVDLLLRAFAATLARTPGAPTLLIAGPCTDESYRQRLQAEAAALGVGATVHWAPMLTGDTKWGALRSCAAFVLPSHQENFGVAPVEALACGRAVLLSDQVNIWREITGDGAGLAAPDTTAGTAELLQGWWARSAAERAAMGAAARRCFERRFTVDAAAAALSAVLQSVVRPRTKIAILQGGFLPVPPLRGGAVEKIWHRLGREFAERGHEVTHVSRRCDGLAADETVAGVRHRRLVGFDLPASVVALLWRDFCWAWRARRVLPAADVVVTNSICAPLVLPARCGRIYVDVQRMPKGQIGLYRRAARLRANSRAVAEAITHQAPALAARVRVIPNPLPFAPDRAVDWTKKERVVLYVGRLHPEKGLELLLEAWGRGRAAGRLAGWRLELVGSSAVAAGGGGETWAEGLRSRFAGPEVGWCAPIYDAAELSRAYERASVFAYPSVAEKGETFGLAVLEAMAWGAVPVVSDLACFRDFVRNGENGRVFDHRSAGAAGLLLAALEQAAHADSRPLAERAVQVRETHSGAAIAELFLADFAEVAGAAASRHRAGQSETN